MILIVKVLGGTQCKILEGYLSIYIYSITCRIDRFWCLDYSLRLLHTWMLTLFSFNTHICTSSNRER
jgi:hypothetical protein